MLSPEISVVVATHNRANLLPLTIDSLIKQTFTNIEIIIVDDASTDETPRVIGGLIQSETRVRALRSDVNIGPGAARNLGISNARGEYIAIMDDDDVSLPNRLEIQLKAFEDDPQLGLVCSMVEYVNYDKEIVGLSPEQPNGKPFPDNPHDIFTRLYLEGSILINPTIMAKRHIWEKFNYPNFPWDAEDRFLFMQMAAKGVRMKFIKQPLVRMLQDPKHESLTRISYQKRIPAKREILRMTRVWLKNEGIHQFDRYHCLAISNQFLRESAHYKRNPRALILIVRAFLSAPKNDEVKNRMLSYIKAFRWLSD